MMNTGRGPGWTLEHNKVGLRPGRGLGGYEDTINSLMCPLTKTEESLAVFLVLQLLLATDTTCRQHCHVTHINTDCRLQTDAHVNTDCRLQTDTHVKLYCFK